MKITYVELLEQKIKYFLGIEKLLNKRLVGIAKALAALNEALDKEKTGTKEKP